MRIMLSLFLHMLKESEDARFIAEIYGKYKNLIRSEIRKLDYDKNDTEDLMQDVFLKLIKHERRLKEIEPDKRVCYIIRVVHTTVATFLAKKLKYDFVSYLEDLENISYEAGSLDQAILDIEAMEQYRSIYEAMKPKEQNFLRMKYALYFTDEEIAEELDLKVESVHPLVYRARKQFEKLLDNKMKRDMRLYGEDAVPVWWKKKRGCK